jgi:hypothetical protein
VHVNTSFAKVQFLSQLLWVQTEVRALNSLSPRLTINTLAAVTNAQPPVFASAVAISKLTVISFPDTVIPVPVTGGSPPLGVSSPSLEQEVKKLTPKADIKAKAPDFFKKSLLSDDRLPVLIVSKVFMTTNTEINGKWINPIYNSLIEPLFNAKIKAKAFSIKNVFCLKFHLK